MQQLPENLLIDIDEPLMAFKSIVCALDMPTMDLDAVLDQIFTAIVDSGVAANEVENLAYYMSHSDAMFENAHLADDVKIRVYNAVQEFGYRVLALLEYYRAFDKNGLLPYYYRGMLNVRTILLSQKPTCQVPSSRIYHPRHNPVTSELYSEYPSNSNF